MATQTGGNAVFIQNRDFFGTMVTHVPLLYALRQQAPDLPLIVYAPFEHGRMFATLGLADDVHVYHSANWALWRQVHARRFDTIVSLRPLSLGLTLLIAAARARRSIGYATLLSRCAFHTVVPRNKSIYRPINYLNLLGDVDPLATCAASMRALAQQSQRDLGAPGSRYCVMPCGREQQKLWGTDNYIALCQAIAAFDAEARFTLVIGKAEIGIHEQLKQTPLSARVTALVDASLADIARAVFASRVVIANDCGPSHVAQLTGVPTIVLFGNWDGRVDTRIREWFGLRAGARCVTTEAAAPITSIPPACVFEHVRALCDNPHSPPPSLR